MISKLKEAIKCHEIIKRLGLKPNATLKHFVPQGEKDLNKWYKYKNEFGINVDDNL